MSRRQATTTFRTRTPLITIVGLPVDRPAGGLQPRPWQSHHAAGSPDPARLPGELVAVFIETRTLTDPDELVYSVTGDAYRVEPHKKLMWRTRPATDTQVAEVQPMLARMLGESVTVLRRGLRTVAKHRPEVPSWETADELPAPENKDPEFEF